MGATGESGPQSIWAPENFALLRSFAAVGRTPLWSPPSWGRGRVARACYAILRDAARFPWLQRRRCKARVDAMLSRWSLPSSYVPPVPVPQHPGAGRALRRAATREAWSLVGSLRLASARVWVGQHLRFSRARMIRWCDAVNGPRACAAFRAQRLAHRSVETLAALAQGRDLRASPGQWRLPVWGEVGPHLDSLARALASWAARLAIPARGRAATQHRLASPAAGALAQVPPAPLEWRRAERRMQAFRETHEVLLLDDKVGGKVWGSSHEGVWAMTLSNLRACSATWQRSEALPEDAVALTLAAGLAGLPAPLRGRQRRGLPAPPKLHVLIKSKCWSDTGAWRCGRSGHSCLRRVSDWSSTPWRPAWKVVGRSIQGVLSLGASTFDAWDINEAAPLLDRALSRLLHPTQACVSCGRARPPVVFGVYDASQAFEVADAGALPEAFMRLWAVYAQAYDTQWISVKRGRRPRFSPGAAPWHQGWVRLGCDDIVRALRASLVCRTVFFGDQAYKTSGVPIGGVISRQSLSVALGVFEVSHCTYSWQQHFGAVRYVDDLVLASTTHCIHCLDATVQKLYGGLFSQTGHSGQGWCHWLDMELHAGPAGVFLRPRNCNREWILGRACARSRFTVLPWAGAPTMSPGALYGWLVGRAARFRAMPIPPRARTLALLELVAEVLRVGYPWPFIRAVCHRLPHPWPEARAVQRTVRAAQALAAAMDSRRGGRGGRERGSGKDRGRGKQGSRRHGHRTRSARSASSSSSSESAARGGRGAERDISPGYKKYLQEKREARREASARRQAQVLASVLDEKFDKVQRALEAAAGQGDPGWGATPGPGGAPGQWPPHGARLPPEVRGPPAQFLPPHRPHFPPPHPQAWAPHPGPQGWPAQWAGTAGYPPGGPDPMTHQLPQWPQPPAQWAPSAAQAASPLGQPTPAQPPARGLSAADQTALETLLGYIRAGPPPAARPSAPDAGAATPTCPQASLGAPGGEGGTTPPAREPSGRPAPFSPAQRSLLEQVLKLGTPIPEDTAPEAMVKLVATAMKREQVARGVTAYLRGRGDSEPPRALRSRAEALVQTVMRL